MAIVTTTYLKLSSGQPGTGQLWAGGALIGQSFASLDSYSSGVFNVMAYGAAGNGSTDDSSAIQSTLDAAAAYAAASAFGIRGTVVFPALPFLIGASTRLHVKSATTIVAYDAYIFKGGVPSNGILANFISGSDSFAGYAGNSQISIYGGVWDARGQNAAANAAYDTIDFNHGRDIHCQDMVIRNGCSDHALEFNSVDGGRAINCRFEGFRDATAGLTRQFSEAVQIDCAVSGAATIPLFDNTHSKNITVMGCYMGPAVDGSGLGSYGKLAGSHTTASGQTYSNIKILGNTVDGALDVGIGAYNWSDSIIAGNTILNTTSHGIRVTVPDPVAAGFSVLSTGVVVTGNAIDTVSGSNHGIEILGYTATAGVADCIVDANSVRNASGIGIFAQLVTVSITGNAVISSGSNGINLTAVSNSLVQGNRIYHPGSNYCVFLTQVTSPSTVSSTNNDISGNTFVMGTGVTAAVKLSTGCSNNRVHDCDFIKDGYAGTIAVTHDPGALTNYVYHNKMQGFGDVAATITVTSGTCTKTLPVGANVGTNIF